MADTSFWDAADEAMAAPPAQQPAPQAAPPPQSNSFWDVADQAMQVKSPQAAQREQELAPRVEQSNQWAAQKNQDAPVQVMGVPGWDINLGKEVGSETLGGVGVSVKDILRRSVPGTEFQGKEETKRYGEAKKAYDEYLSGKTDDKPSDEQLGRIAEYEYDQQREAARSQRSKIAAGALGVPKVLGEFAAAGPVAGAVGGALGGGLAATAAGTAAATPLMPEFWLQESQERANKNGGDWYDPKNVSVPLAKAAVQNVVLGQVAKFAGAAADATAKSSLGQLGVRAAVGAAAMPLESTAAETLTSTVQAALSETKFGKYLDPDEEQFKTFRDVLAGKWGDVGTKLATDALIGAGFSAFHGKEPNQVEALTKAGEALKKSGLSDEGVAKALQDAVSKPPDDLAKGAVRDYVESAHESAKEAIKSSETAAEPPTAQTPAGQEIAQPTEPQVGSYKDRAESFQKASEGDREAHLVALDTDNMAGLAKKAGPEVAKQFQQQALGIIHEELAKAGEVSIHRAGSDANSDEHSAIITAPKADVQAALQRAEVKIQALGSQFGEVPRVSEKEGPSRPGLTSFVEPIKKGSKLATVDQEAGLGIETMKGRRAFMEGKHSLQTKEANAREALLRTGVSPEAADGLLQRGEAESGLSGEARTPTRPQGAEDQGAGRANPQGDQAGPAEAERPAVPGAQVGKKESTVDRSRKVLTDHGFPDSDVRQWEKEVGSDPKRIDSIVRNLEFNEQRMVRQHLDLASFQAGMRETKQSLKYGTEGAAVPGAAVGKKESSVAPWQMTRDQFVKQAPKAARGEEPPTVEKLLGNRQEGSPGITSHKSWGHTQEIVMRDNKGKAIGALVYQRSFEHQGENYPDTILGVAVKPEYQRQGIASKLYEKAKSEGFDVEKATGQGGYTESGARLAHRRAVTEALSQGKNVPSEVLKDYPGLKAVPGTAVGKEKPALMTPEEAWKVPILTPGQINAKDSPWKEVSVHKSHEEAATAAGHDGAVMMRPGPEIIKGGPNRTLDEVSRFGRGIAVPEWVAYKKAGAEEPAVTPASHAEDQAAAMLANKMGSAAGMSTAAKANFGPKEVEQAKAAGRSFVSRVVDSFRELGGAIAPRTSRLSQEAGNKIARYISSRSAAGEQSPVLIDKVLPEPIKNAKNLDALAGGTLVEMRLRNMRKADLNESARAAAAGDKKTAEKYQKLAEGVGSIVGKPMQKDGDPLASPLAFPSDFENALKDPDVQATLAKYREVVAPQLDANYKRAEGLEPDEDIPNFTQIPGMPVNLKAWKAGETGTGVAMSGNLKNPRARRFSFARQAKGSAEGYDISLSAMIDHSLKANAEVAAKADMYRQLVKDGLAAFGPLGTRPEGFDHEIPNAVPDRGLRNLAKPGETSLFFKDPEVMKEVRKALDVDLPWKKIPLTGAFNFATLASLGEATAHTKNLMTMMVRPGMSVSKLVKNLYGVVRQSPEVKDRLIELAQMGALKPKGFEANNFQNTQPTTALQKVGHAIQAPIRMTGKFLDVIDRSMRLTADQAFDKISKIDGVEKTEGARRDFINQLGQYNRKAQNYLIQSARDTGLGPFATAGSNFYANSMRDLFLGHGVKTNSIQADLKLRTAMLGRFVAVASIVPVINYLLHKRVDGDDDTPIGAIKIGEWGGKTRYFDLLGLTGITRGLRETGLLAAAEGARPGARAAGATSGTTFDRMFHDAVQSIGHPFEGPVVSAINTAITGEDLLGRKIAATPSTATTSKGQAKAEAMGKPESGESQTGYNFLAAAIHANPVLAALAEATGVDPLHRKGASVVDAVMRQFGPYGIKASGSPPGMPHRSITVPVKAKK